MKKRLTTHTPVSFCPACGYTLDAASSFDEAAAPSAGDFSVCIACAAVLRFDRELRLRAASPALVAQACSRDPELRRSLLRTLASVREMHRVMGVPPDRPSGAVN